MRILHTADWHLGKKLDQHDRTEEHQLFINWLLQYIEAEKVEVLIIAGDIFDSGTPSNESLKMYYTFLVNLHSTCCRQAIIIGGNHDSISTLNAPRDLLLALQVHVVGGVPELVKDQIIPIKDAEGKVQAVVAAVPFLRDKDVRLSIPGEDAKAREQRLREGILQHYRALLPHVEAYKREGIPLIATGHLFAAGAAASDSEKEIHVGTLGQVPAGQFPAEYDYIALGHLHKPQTVSGLSHVRYSGSPVPLCFGESSDAKQVVLLQAVKGEQLEITTVPVPEFRKLIRLKGTPDAVKQQALQLSFSQDDVLPVWVEVQAQTNSLISNLYDDLQAILQNKPGFGQLFLRQVRLREATGIQETSLELLDLVDMSPEHVFDLRLTSIGETEQQTALRSTYSEALQKMQEKEGVT